MKTIALVLALVSAQAFAIDMGAVKAAGAKAADKAKSVAEACKSEQVEFCKGMKEMSAIKECLTKNKEKLSEGCKSTLTM